MDIIKPNELRVGNLVHATTAGNVGNGELVIHTIIDGKDIDNAHWYFQIPITEKWLTRFGFERCEDEKYHWFMLNGIRVETFGMQLPFKQRSIGVNIGNVVFHFKYVHQLQNIYFALKGTELQMQPIFILKD